MAQGICADHADAYANYWLHNGFLNFGAEKMSKSLGNVVLVHDLVTKAPGEAIRWALLAAHYRQPLAWSDEVLEQATRSLDTLYGALQRAADVRGAGDRPERRLPGRAGGRPQHAAGLRRAARAGAAGWRPRRGVDRAADQGRAARPRRI